MSSVSTPRKSRFWGTLVFGTGVFASAFLIFLVQPMVGKRIVPWFGGAPGVWTLCLAFYQSALFFGYAYAHLLATRISPLRQLGIHALLFAIAFAVLPVLPGEAWKPLSSADPSVRILAMLAANVALPFLMLAATGPPAPSVVRECVPRTLPLSAVRPVESRLPAGAARLSLHHRTPPSTLADLGAVVVGVRARRGRRSRLWWAQPSDTVPPLRERPLPRTPPSGAAATFRSDAVRTAPMGAVAGLRGRNPHGGIQRAVPGCRERALPLDRAALHLPPDLHLLLRV